MSSKNTKIIWIQIFAGAVILISFQGCGQVKEITPSNTTPSKVEKSVDMQSAFPEITASPSNDSSNNPSPSATTPQDTPTYIPSATTTKIPPPPEIKESGQLWVSPIDDAEMVGVPSGEFTMGNANGHIDEQPEHVVYLDAFYIDKYEVTNELYRRCVESGACIKLKKPEYFNNPDNEQHPVVNVTIAWAKMYCKWAGKRVPTEAQWEKAARGTDGRSYPWGEEVDCDHAQYKACGGQTVPIGTNRKGISPYGAMDMAGNVWEWVTDIYQEDFYQASPYRNPHRTGKGNEFVFRGGSWSEDAEFLRSTYRSWYNPNAQYYNLGFRCVRNLN